MSDSTLPPDPGNQARPPLTPRPSGTTDDESTLSQNHTAPVVGPAPALGVFGDYELLAEIARGGMGVVYKARQQGLNRIVALKMILAGRLADADDLSRFQTEAEAAARLQHPNIVTVHDVGEVDGQRFYSMEFIEGHTLAHRLADGPLPGRTAARYVSQIARAVHYAHRQGILHRDLKPSNIMIDAADQPHVTDFGLAKRLGGDSGQTRTGAVLGTPSYMAPEQAQGKIKELSAATDVYGLGAVLYELLTGRPPFRAETPLDTMVQVIENDPVPPRLLNPKVDADLETVCLKCLEKEPRSRYSSAEAVANDLERYLSGESISARSFNLLDRLSRTLERSQHDAAFSTWSTMILIIAAIVLVEHIAVFMLNQMHQPRTLVTAARFTQLILIALVFWKNRRSRLLPTTGAERELWTIWIGYLLTYGATLLTVHSLVNDHVLRPGPAAPAAWESLIVYPCSALISGLAFFVMGSNYWGRCYAVGVIFWGMALLMPLHLEWAPLEFGLVWSGALTALALHLRKLGRKAEESEPERQRG